MKTVPLSCSNGSLPLRASKNPVLGVFRHHCGELASVHQPKGKRSKTRYLICDSCGTDQCGGADYQAKIKAGTHATIEDLQAAENAVSTVKTVVEIKESELIESVRENSDEIVSDVEPLQAKPTLAQAVKQSVENASVILTEEITVTKPLQAAPVVAPTVKSVTGEVEPKPNTIAVNDPKPMRIGIAAIIGGLVGGLLAAVA